MVPKIFWSTNCNIKASKSYIRLVICASFDSILSFVLDCFFNESKICPLLRFEVMQKYQIPKECLILHKYHIRSLIQNLEALILQFVLQKILGTTMVPILLWNSPYSSTLLNEQYVNVAHKWVITTKHGTQVVPKNVFSKNIYFQLSNAVSIICIVILDQKLLPIQCS